MIETAISVVGARLNEHLKSRFLLHEDKVSVSGLVGQDGSIAVNEENRLIVSLLNVENEPAAGSRVDYRALKGGVVKQRQALHLNLYFLVAAHFATENYNEALKYISETVSFFQVNNHLDSKSEPRLEGKVEQLLIEICRWNIDETSRMWHMMGAKYLPSVAYKMRMITFIDNTTSLVIPVTSGVDSSVTATTK